jgi:hypothetical protein
MKATVHLGVMRPSIVQRGAASVGIAVLIILLMGAAVSTALSLSGSVARDAVSAEQQVQALFLAESGLERATYRFGLGAVACASLGETGSIGTGTFATSNGSNTLFDGTPSGASCRVRVAGTVTNGGVVRAIEAVLGASGTFATQDFTCTVPSGTNLMLVLTISWGNSGSAPVSVASVRFNNVNMTSAAPVTSQSDGTNTFAAQNFYLRNPTVGTNVGGTIVLNANPGDFAVVGCHVLAGADLSAPIDKVSSSHGMAPSAGTNFGIAPASSGTTNPSWFIIENLARDNGGNTPMTAAIGRTKIWSTPANRIASARSHTGPIGPSTNVNLYWQWTQGGKPYASAAVAVPATSIISWEAARVTLSSTAGAGVKAWREVTVPPI